MKKLWKQYSYTIILFVLGIAVLLIFSGSFQDDKHEKYMTVTVEQGDSLWKLSKQYGEEHRLSTEQFIHWVEKENGVVYGDIYTGDSLLIPVEKNMLTNNEYAIE